MEDSGVHMSTRCRGVQPTNSTTSKTRTFHIRINLNSLGVGLRGTRLSVSGWKDPGDAAIAFDVARLWKALQLQEDLHSLGPKLNFPVADYMKRADILQWLETATFDELKDYLVEDAQQRQGGSGSPRGSSGGAAVRGETPGTSKAGSDRPAGRSEEAGGSGRGSRGSPAQHAAQASQQQQQQQQEQQQEALAGSAPREKRKADASSDHDPSSVASPASGSPRPAKKQAAAAKSSLEREPASPPAIAEVQRVRAILAKLTGAAKPRFSVLEDGTLEQLVLARAKQATSWTWLWPDYILRLVFGAESGKVALVHQGTGQEWEGSIVVKGCLFKLPLAAGTVLGVQAGGAVRFKRLGSREGLPLVAVEAEAAPPAGLAGCAEGDATGLPQAQQAQQAYDSAHSHQGGVSTVRPKQQRQGQAAKEGRELMAAAGRASVGEGLPEAPLGSADMGAQLQGVIEGAGLDSAQVSQFSSSWLTKMDPVSQELVYWAITQAHGLGGTAGSELVRSLVADTLGACRLQDSWRAAGSCRVIS